MTNRYALGYKAGLDAAVKVCEEMGALDAMSDEDIGSAAMVRVADKQAELCAKAIAALPVPSSSSEDCGEVHLPKTLEGGYELCEDEGCPNRDIIHYCRSVPEVQWRDLTDEEIFGSWKAACEVIPTCDRHKHFAKAVIAKFKEKQL